MYFSPFSSSSFTIYIFFNLNFFLFFFFSTKFITPWSIFFPLSIGERISLKSDKNCRFYRINSSVSPILKYFLVQVLNISDNFLGQNFWFQRSDRKWIEKCSDWSFVTWYLWGNFFTFFIIEPSMRNRREFPAFRKFLVKDQKLFYSFYLMFITQSSMRNGRDDFLIVIWLRPL